MPYNNAGSNSRGGSSRGSQGGDRSSNRPSRDSRGGSSRPDSRDSRGGSDRPSRPSSDRPARSFGDRDDRRGGSRPDSRGGSDRPARSYGDRPDSRGGSDRPSRPSSDRPARSYGDRPNRPSSDRPARSYGDRDSRGGSDRPARSYGARPDSRGGSDRPSRPSSDRPARSFGDRPDSRGGSDRPARSFGDRPSRPSSERPGRSFGDRDSRGGSDRPSRPSSDRPARNWSRDDRPKASDDRRSGGRDARGGRPDRAGGRFSDRDRDDRRSTGRDSTRNLDKRVNVQDPIIPDHITGEELDRSVRNELRTLPDGLALRVARHLAASNELALVDPELAWEHARAALNKAARVGIIREAAAEAAYRAGHFAEALTEFRAAKRMNGAREYWPLMADCERALGRPGKAIEMAGDPVVAKLERPARVEMRIVAAGARADQKNLEAALATLQCPELTTTSAEPWAARIRYAYADILEQMDRKEEAIEWFHRAAAVDAEEQTDSDERIAILEGIHYIDTDEGYEIDDDVIVEVFDSADVSADVDADVEDSESVEIAELDDDVTDVTELSSESTNG